MWRSWPSSVCLKLQINQKVRKILYAEADKDFVDFLFTILSLPIVNVINLLSNNQATSLGSLGTLQRSVDRLDQNYFQSKKIIDDLQTPKPSLYIKSSVRTLLGLVAPPSKNYYRCNGTSNANCRNHISTWTGTPCPACKGPMELPVTYVYGASEGSPKNEGFVKGMVSYMVMDDLTVKPMSSASVLSVLRELNVHDAGLVEEKVVYLQTTQAIKLLRASMHSSTVLTDVFLRNINFTSF